MSDFLKKNCTCQSVQKMTYEEMQDLALELRQFIIEKVSKTGGHLASNLGVIELTLALCKVFDFPEDKIVWDVGHQSYVYKILTGRMDQFDQLRQWQGLSGFPKREESEYDSFNTGHSSTSISAALGILRGERQEGKDNYVIACIGDGALTGGMSFEALNDVGQGDENLIVLINDNQMSISANVGGLKNHLNHLRTKPSYIDLKETVNKTLNRVPKAGRPMSKLLRRMKRSVRRRVNEENNAMYEALGLRYYGPVDGHNLHELSQVLQAAKNHAGPVVVHVSTIKGKGYDFAVDNPDSYHGVAPFVVEDGLALSTPKILSDEEKENLPENISSVKGYGEAFSQSLQYFAAKEEKLIGICAAMSNGTKMDAFSQVYPERFFDVGIAEQHAVTMAAGLASTGKKPLVAVYSTFLQRALDQVMHDVVLQNLPVIFCLDRAGIVGEDGETHQGLYDLSFLQALPSGEIFVPRDGKELFFMMQYALEVKDHPVFIRYPKGNHKFTDDDLRSIEEYLRTSGQDNLALDHVQVIKEGSDLNVIAWGYTSSLAYHAAKKLEEEGISARVIDVRELKNRCIEDFEEYLTLPSLIVEEAIFQGSLSERLFSDLGIRSAKKEKANDTYRMRAIHLPNQAIHQGKRDLVLEACGISLENIVQVAKALLH